MAETKDLPTEARRFRRIRANNHIKGLGLEENLKAIRVKDNIVGQERAREVRFLFFGAENKINTEVGAAVLLLSKFLSKIKNEANILSKTSPKTMEPEMVTNFRF